MNKFFESNPGLKSRFNTFIEFDDYCVEELMAILSKMCTSNDYKISEALFNKISQHLSDVIANKEENFANGRLARNIYEDLVINHARRVSNVKNASREELSLLTEDYFISTIIER